MAGADVVGAMAGADVVGLSFVVTDFSVLELLGAVVTCERLQAPSAMVVTVRAMPNNTRALMDVRRSRLDVAHRLELRADLIKVLNIFGNHPVVTPSIGPSQEILITAQR